MAEERLITQEEQKEVVNILAVLTGYMANFAGSNELLYMTLRSMCLRATDLVAEFETDELKKARLLKEIEEAKAHCDCPVCQPKLDA